MHKSTQTIVFFAITSFAISSQANLIGESIEANVNDTQTVVDPGIEFSLLGGGSGSAQANFFDSSLDLIFNTGDTFRIGADLIWSFTLDASDLVFVSVVETADNFINGVSFDGITDAGKTINFTILDQDHPNSTTYTASYAITTRDTGSVPAPATLPLFGLGLAATGFVRRKRVGA